MPSIKSPGRHQNDRTSERRRSSRLGSNEGTPRTLIQGFLESTDTAAPLVRHKRRVSDRLSTSHPALPAGRRSVPVPMGNRSLNIDKDTPRTLLQNYLQNNVTETPYITRPAPVVHITPDMTPSQGSYRTPSPFRESSKSSTSLPYSSARKARSRINTGRFHVAEMRSPTPSNGSVHHRQSQDEEDLGVFDSSNEEDGQTDQIVTSRQQNMEHTRHGTFRIPQIPQHMTEIYTNEQNDNSVDKSRYDGISGQELEYVAQLESEVGIQPGNAADGRMVEPYNLYEMRMESASGDSHLEDKENVETMSSASVEVAELYNSKWHYGRDSLQMRGSQGRGVSADIDSYGDFAAGSEKLSFRDSASPVTGHQDGQNVQQRGRWSDGHASRFGDQLDDRGRHLRGRLSEGHRPGMDSGDGNFSPLSNNNSMSKSRVGEDTVRGLSGVSIDTVHRRVRHLSGETLGSDRSRSRQSFDGMVQDGSPHLVNMQFSSRRNSTDQQIELSGLQGQLTAERHSRDHSRVRHTSGESERGRQDYTAGNDLSNRRSGSNIHNTVYTEQSSWLQQHTVDQHSMDHSRVRHSSGEPMGSERSRHDPVPGLQRQTRHDMASGRRSGSDFHSTAHTEESSWSRQSAENLHSSGQVPTFTDSRPISRTTNMGEPSTQEYYAPLTINDFELSSRSRMFTPTNSHASFNANDLIIPGKISTASKDVAILASSNQMPEPMSHDRSEPGTASRRRSKRDCMVSPSDGIMDNSGALGNESHVTISMDRTNSSSQNKERSSSENDTRRQSRSASRVVQESHPVMLNAHSFTPMQDNPKLRSVVMTPRGSATRQEHGSVSHSTRSTRSRNTTELEETNSKSVPMDFQLITGASVPEDDDGQVHGVSDGEDNHVTDVAVPRDRDGSLPHVSDREDGYATNEMAPRAENGPVSGPSDEDDNQWEDDEMVEPSDRRIPDATGSNKKKTTTRRKPRKPSAYSMPVSLVKKQFSLFAGVRVDKDAIEEVMKTSETYWNNIAKDLEAYALHARRKTIQMEDFILLFRRQRLINDKCSLDSLIREHLPMEEQNKLIYVARANNVIEPKL